MVDVIGGKIRPVKEARCGLIDWSSPPTRGPVFPRGDTACQRHFRQVTVFKRDRLGQETQGGIFTSAGQEHRPRREALEHPPAPMH